MLPTWMNYLFSPKSIAIVGASSDTSKFTGRTLKYLLKHGYRGKIYPVNAKYRDLMGLRCYANVAELPEVVDCAFIQIPNALVLDIVKECAEKGIKTAVIHTAGLAESGEIGKIKQLEMIEIARSKGMRICGPNSAGLVNVIDHVALSPVVSLELDNLTPGRIGFVSQSGGMIGSLLTRAEARGIGFSYLISSGNEGDLEVSDYIEFMLNDTHTRVVIVFLEGLRNVEKFLKVANLALEKEKPILVLKVGRSEVGSKAAMSHTGSLAGSDRVYEAIFRQRGIIRVRGFEDLFEAASLFSKCKPQRGNRIGIVTTTGGVSMLIIDECSTYGFQFPKPSLKTLDLISKGLPSFASFSNPLDVTMSGVGVGYRQALTLFLQDENFDIVIAVVGTSGQFVPEMGVKPILESAKVSGKTLVAFLNPNAEEALRLLERGGIPTFRTPDSCARVLKNYYDHGKYLETHLMTEPKIGTQPVHIDPTISSNLRRILDSTSSILNEFESKRLLSLFGIPITKEKMVSTLEEAFEAAEDIGYPLVVKLVSSDIPHKTEAGVVQMGIRNEDELTIGFERVIRKGKEYMSDVKIEGVLIQEMVQNGTEVMVGMSQDVQFGPTILFGVGGVFVELLNEVSLRVAPLQRIDVEEMIDEVKTSVILKGFRGKERADMEALIDVLLRFSQLSIFVKEVIKEIDINPLMVMGNGKGVKAVDALIIKKQDGKNGKGQREKG